MTTSAPLTMLPVSGLGSSALMSTPISFMASTTRVLRCSAGSLPADRTVTVSPASLCSSPAAIWLRPALCTQTKRTSGICISIIPRARLHPALAVLLGVKALDRKAAVRDEGGEQQQDGVQGDVRVLAPEQVEHDRADHQQHKAGRGHRHQPVDRPDEAGEDEGDSGEAIRDTGKDSKAGWHLEHPLHPLPQTFGVRPEEERHVIHEKGADHDLKNPQGYVHDPVPLV